MSDSLRITYRCTAGHEVEVFEPEGVAPLTQWIQDDCWCPCHRVDPYAGEAPDYE